MPPSFFNSYFFYACLLLLLTIIIVTIIVISLIILLIIYKYDTRIYNWIKHSVERFCNLLNTQIYSYSYEAQNVLRLYGDQQIVSLTLHRKPIPSFVNTGLNIISGGKWNEERKQYNRLNTIYHLVVECGLVNGTKVFCQKNERIEINTTYEATIQTEFFPVSLADKTFTLNDMLKKTNELMGDSKYFLFNQMDNNCQVYIKNLLKAVDLYSETVDHFVFQDKVEEVFAKFGPIANKIIELCKGCAILYNKFIDTLFSNLLRL